MGDCVLTGKRIVFPVFRSVCVKKEEPMKKFFKLGTHLELVPVGYTLDSPDAYEKKYISSVHEVLQDETVVITNPTHKSQMIHLRPGEKYDCYLFLDNKIFKCRIKVLRSRNDFNLRVVETELLTNIVKYERRQFFRLDVAMDIRYLTLRPDNTAAFKEAVKTNSLLQMEGFQTATTRDVSGGGLRFVCNEELPIGSMLITHIETEMDGRPKQYVFLAKVLASKKHEEIRGLYESRVQFVDLKQSAREELVQYIFHCQREQLKKHSG